MGPVGHHGVVSRRDRTLLDQIEDDAVNGRPIADTLRKAVILGGKAGSTSLRDWATKELKGYGPDDDLPEYRTVGAPICIDAVAGYNQIKGQQISTFDLPDFAQEAITQSVPLLMGIGEIDGLVMERERTGDRVVQLMPPSAAELVKYMNSTRNEPFQQITALYWSVSPAALRGVVDQVRTALAELVSEMRAGTPVGEDVPSAEVADQAVNVAIHGKNARVVVTAQKAGGDATSTSGPQTDSDWWTTWRKVGASLVGAATIAAAVFGFLALRQ